MTDTETLIERAKVSALQPNAAGMASLAASDLLALLTLVQRLEVERDQAQPVNAVQTINRLERALSDECANSLRLAQELSSLKRRGAVAVVNAVDQGYDAIVERLAAAEAALAAEKERADTAETKLAEWAWHDSERKCAAEAQVAALREALRTIGEASDDPTARETARGALAREGAEA